MAPSRKFVLATAAASIFSTTLASPRADIVNDPNMPVLSTYADYTLPADMVSTSMSSVASSMMSTASTPVSSSASITTSVPAMSSSSIPYSNPFTVYLTETNSLGVITGMPTVVTSQPAVATECGGCASYSSIYANGTTLVKTTMASATTTHSASGSSTSSSNSTSSASASQTFSQTNAGVATKITGSGIALVVLGCVFALL